MRTFLLTAGIAGMLTFLATGAYMRISEPGMDERPPETRMLYRSRHIYLLLASSVCLVAGIHYRAAVGSLRFGLQSFGLLLCAAAIGLLFAAFVIEPQGTVEEVNFGRLGAFAVFGGTVLQLVSIARLPGRGVVAVE